MHFCEYILFKYCSSDFSVVFSLQLTDLVFFLLILFVFVVSFGTAYHANLYPNTELSWNILKNVIYIPYWQTYGIYNLDVIEGTYFLTYLTDFLHSISSFVWPTHRLNTVVRITGQFLDSRYLARS